MKLFRFTRRNEAGFHLHVILPILAVVAVAGIGSYVLGIDHAQTISCRTFYYEQGASNNRYSGGGSAQVCTNYIQKILNGAYQANLDNYQLYANNYAKAAGQQTGYLPDTGKFNPATTAYVEAFQDRFANLKINGEVAGDSWSALCGIGLHMPNPTAHYYWEREALGAAMHSGCVAANPKTGAPGDVAPNISTASTTSRIPPSITNVVVVNNQGSDKAQWPYEVEATVTYAASCTQSVNGLAAGPVWDQSKITDSSTPKRIDVDTYNLVPKTLKITCTSPGGSTTTTKFTDKIT